MTQKQKLNFIDVFAGAGGLSCGMEMAGWKCLLGVDFDKYAMETFAANHKHAQTFCGDIKELSEAQLKELLKGETVHAVVGGPPCQGFSTVGVGNPKDERNHLFMEFVRLVRLTKPLFVIMENVTGLVASKNESTLHSIFKKFGELGYHMNVKVMSADHYGVPEKRRRTILIGSRLGGVVEYPKETHNTVVAKTFRPARTVGDVFADLAAKNGEIYNHDLAAAKISNLIDRKRIAKIPEGKGIRYERDEKAYLKSKELKLGIDWESIREGRFRQTKYHRLNRAEPSPTIMTHRHNYFHPTENRYLTAREAAAIQSFPNDFVFKGPLSAQWRQIGNAVPPLLGVALGKQLLAHFKKHQALSTTKKVSQAAIDTTIRLLREKAFHYRGEKVARD